MVTSWLVKKWVSRGFREGERLCIAVSRFCFILLCFCQSTKEIRAGADTSQAGSQHPSWDPSPPAPAQPSPLPTCDYLLDIPLEGVPLPFF